MKKLIVVLAIAAMAQSSFASEQSTQALGYTVAEIIVSTAVTVATSEAFTISTSGLDKREARRIQAEVQEYNQTGAVSVYLADKIQIVNSLDNTLSTDESVDVLLNAAEIILAN